jgi:hypothetical protein
MLARGACTTRLRRLLWFFGLWLLGVGAVGLVSAAIRLWLT